MKLPGVAGFGELNNHARKNSDGKSVMSSVMGLSALGLESHRESLDRDVLGSLGHVDEEGAEDLLDTHKLPQLDAV